MLLASLPVEILMLVADCLISLEDLCSFTRATHRLYTVLSHQLYRRNVKSDGGSALGWYAIRGNEHGVKTMLAAGADVNLLLPTQAQSPPLIEAVFHGHTHVVQILLENGALPDMTDLQARRPLALAAIRHSNVAIMKLLLDYGAKVDRMKFENRSPLMEAIRSNQGLKVALLLEHGADTQVLERSNMMNLLHIAAAKNAAPAIIKMLIDTGVKVDSQDGTGRTPLHVAADCSSIRAVRILLYYGANPNFKNMTQHPLGRTALFYAAKQPRNLRKDNKTIIRTLVSHGADVDFMNDMQQTPLLYAVSQGAVKQAQELLDCGASITARDVNGKSVLHLAISSWHPRSNMINWLVKCGADVDWADSQKRETPIFYAIRQRYRDAGLEILRSLLALGADINVQNVDGLTPLSLAAQKCSVALITMLLECGAAVNSIDMQGKSPLHHAAEDGFGFETGKVITLLIEHGADVNCRDHYGYTPLHRLVIRDVSWEAVGVLLKLGADPYAMSNDGKYPHDLVPDGPWAETKRLLIRSYTS